MREAITEYQEQQHRFKGRLEKVPLKMLVKVHESSFNNIFVDNFPKFPVVYKKVLYVLANYFRYEISPCSESQFEAMCSRISTKPMFLIPVLRDLQDMGLIQLKFM